MVLKRRIIIIMGSAFLIGQRRMRVFWVLEREQSQREGFSSTHNICSLTVLNSPYKCDHEMILMVDTRDMHTNLLIKK